MLSWSQRPLAARQQTVQMPGLRRARPRLRLIRQAVAVQHDHPFEIVGERAHRGRTAHTGADHYGLFTDRSACYHSTLLIHAAAPQRETNRLQRVFNAWKFGYNNNNNINVTAAGASISSR